MFLGETRDLLRLKFGYLLLGGVGQHAEPGDVDESEHAGLGAIDHKMPEGFEAAPAGTARIGHCRYASAKAESVWLYALVASPGATRARGEEQVRVDIDEPGGNMEPVNVDHLFGLRGTDVGCDSGNLTAGNCYVHLRVDAVFGIDQVAAFEHDVVLSSCDAAKEQSKDEVTHGRSAPWLYPTPYIFVSGTIARPSRRPPRHSIPACNRS